MYATVQLLTGDPPPEPLLDSMLAAESTRYQLIAAGGDPLETSFNEMFATTLGSQASLWVVPGIEHMGAFPVYPAEYEKTLSDFFNRELLESPAN
jgi:hypothetical protein